MKLQKVKDWLLREGQQLSADEAFTKYAVNGNPSGIIEVLTKRILDRVYRESDSTLETMVTFPTYCNEQMRKELMEAILQKGYTIPYSDHYVFIVRWRQL